MKICFFTVFFILICGVFFYVRYADVIKNNRSNTKSYPYYTTELSQEHLIAHAGGALDGHIYTDALEAYEQSIAAGMKFIEVDLLETKEGKFVAAHDWKTFNEITGENEEKVRSLEEIHKLKIYDKYTPMDEKQVASLMKKYPDIVMVTDKTRDVRHIAEAFPFYDRMIVQTFGLIDYLEALRQGIKYPTLRLKGGRKGIPWVYKKMMQALNVKSVILGELSFNKNKDFIRELHDRGVLVILYGNPLYQIVDHPEQVKKYAGKYIDLFDSDFMQHL